MSSPDTTTIMAAAPPSASREFSASRRVRHSARGVPTVRRMKKKTLVLLVRLVTVLAFAPLLYAVVLGNNGEPAHRVVDIVRAVGDALPAVPALPSSTHRGG